MQGPLYDQPEWSSTDIPRTRKKSPGAKAGVVQFVVFPGNVVSKWVGPEITFTCQISMEVYTIGLNQVKVTVPPPAKCMASWQGARMCSLFSSAHVQSSNIATASAFCRMSPQKHREANANDAALQSTHYAPAACAAAQRRNSFAASAVFLSNPQKHFEFSRS